MSKRCSPRGGYLIVITISLFIETLTVDAFLGRLATAPLPTFLTTAPTKLKLIPSQSEGEEPDALTEALDDVQEVEDEDDDDVDFPLWVRGLRQWPLYPATTSSTSEIPTPEQTAEEQGSKSTSGNDGLDLEDQSNVVNKTSSLVNESADTSVDINELDDEDVSADVAPTNGLLSPVSRILNFEALLAFALGDDDTESEIEDLIETSNEVTNATNATGPGEKEAPEQPQQGKVSTLSRLEEYSAWGQWVGGLRASISDLRKQASSRAAFRLSAEGLLKQATASIESVVAEAASPSTVEALVKRATETVENSTVAADLVESALQLALERGLNVSEATERAKDTTDYAASIAKVAAGVLGEGYVLGDPFPERQDQQELLKEVKPVKGSKALFADFKTAVEINELDPAIVKAAEMGYLSGAIYEETLPRTRALGQTIVARGCAEDVYWMVTDSVANMSSFQETKSQRTRNDPVLIRTITIKGFDASDETVDRELLLNRICTANPKMLENGVLAHAGLLKIAKSIYAEVKQYVDWTAPSHRIVMGGHSVGGSLALLVLLLMTMDRGPEFVQKRVARVYTFGSPPVTALADADRPSTPLDRCEILEAFDLPTTLVQAYVQPWDPIVRLFTEIDSLYPLVSDLGADGVTPFANGPPRTLRPITKAIFEAWDGWPRFRDNYKGTGSQNYTSVGVQHLLLADPTRYLADRFVAVTIPVPPVQTILRISPQELFPALASGFPLDVFEISFVPQAIRGFVHHFYPAYGMPLVDYAKLLESRAEGVEPTTYSDYLDELEKAGDDGKADQKDGVLDWGAAGQWLQRRESRPSGEDTKLEKQGKKERLRK